MRTLPPDHLRPPPNESPQGWVVPYFYCPCYGRGQRRWFPPQSAGKVFTVDETVVDGFRTPSIVKAKCRPVPSCGFRCCRAPGPGRPGRRRPRATATPPLDTSEAFGTINGCDTRANRAVGEPCPPILRPLSARVRAQEEGATAWDTHVHGHGLRPRGPLPRPHRRAQCPPAQSGHWTRRQPQSSAIILRRKGNYVRCGCEGCRGIGGGIVMRRGYVLHIAMDDLLPLCSLTRSAPPEVRHGLAMALWGPSPAFLDTEQRDAVSPGSLLPLGTSCKTCCVIAWLHRRRVRARTAAQHGTAEHSTTQCNAAHHSTAYPVTAQHGTAQHSTAQHSTAQHSTAQHSTAQHSTAMHSTAEHITAYVVPSPWRVNWLERPHGWVQGLSLTPVMICF